MYLKELLEVMDPNQNIVINKRTSKADRVNLRQTQYLL